MSAPPPFEAAASLRRIEALRAEVHDNIKEQHLVSRVILKQFTDQRHLLHPVSVTDRDAKVVPKGPRGVGKVQDFVPQASRSAEDLWARTENQLPSVLMRCERDNLHVSPDALAVVRNAVALHYVRSRSFWAIHESSYQEARMNARRRARIHPGYERDFLRRFGRLPLSEEDHDFYFEMVLARRWDGDFRSGLLFRQSIERMFGRCCQWLNDKSVQLIHPAEGVFLIGDAPVISFDRRGRMGPLEGVAIGDASQVFMPIAPRSLIAFGPPAAGTVSVEMVEELNVFQVRAATDYVFVHPDSGLEDFVRTVRFGLAGTTSEPNDAHAG